MINVGKFCAHRGVSALMPENTLPAFAAAEILGAEEIEFDVWHTKDQKLVVCHDPSLDRISNASGCVRDLTLSQVLSANAGHEKGWQVPFCTPEEIFARLSNRIVFNIHLKEAGENGSIVREILEIAQRYNAAGSFYFAGTEPELEWMQRIAPDVPRVAIQHPGNAERMADIAGTYACAGVQLWRDYFDQNLIDTLHAMGLFLNLFWADSDEDYERYFSMGVDTLLTNRMDLAAAWKARQA